MTRRLLASYLSITALVLAVLVLPLGFTFADHEADVLLAGIERDAQAVVSVVEENLESGVTPSIDNILARYSSGGGRIVVVNADGLSVADSDDISAESRDFSTRPEIQAALAGQRAEGIRWSETLGQNLMYVAAPVASGGQVHGAVRISYPTTELDSRVQDYWLRLGLLSAAVLATVAAVGFVIARGVTRPVRDLQQVADQLSRGRLEARASTDTGPPELRSLGTTVNTMAHQLQQLVESQRSFVADASHQLRTPLTALRLRLETLEPHLPEDQQPRLDAAIAETARLARLVDSLLVLARADAGAVEPLPTDAVGVANERAEAWNSVAVERSVQLQVQTGPCPTVLAVPGSLEQILDNLLSNAIAASPVGGTVTVRVTCELPDAVELQVADEGPGLDEQERERAFERFWRAPGAKAGRGFGLGLAIARRLAESSGGEVTLVPGSDGIGLAAVVRLRSEPPVGQRRPEDRADPRTFTVR